MNPNTKTTTGCFVGAVIILTAVILLFNLVTQPHSESKRYDYKTSTGYHITDNFIDSIKYCKKYSDTDVRYYEIFPQKCVNKVKISGPQKNGRCHYEESIVYKFHNINKKYVCDFSVVEMNKLYSYMYEIVNKKTVLKKGDPFYVSSDEDEMAMFKENPMFEQEVFKSRWARILDDQRFCRLEDTEQRHTSNEKKLIMFSMWSSPPPNTDCFFYRQTEDYKKTILNTLKQNNLQYQYRFVIGKDGEYAEVSTSTGKAEVNSLFIQQNKKLLNKYESACFESEKFCIYNLTKNKMQTKINYEDVYSEATAYSMGEFDTAKSERYKQKITQALMK